jgi:hypothetical protein
VGRVPKGKGVASMRRILPIASHVGDLNEALGTWRRALEEFESALLEFEETPVCEVCGEALTDTRRDAKTCSAACRQKAYTDAGPSIYPQSAGESTHAPSSAPRSPPSRSTRETGAI